MLISHNFSTYTFLFNHLYHTHLLPYTPLVTELRPGQHNLNPGVDKGDIHTWRLSGCNNPNKIRIHTQDQWSHSLCRKDSSPAKATCCWQTQREAVVESSAHLVLHTQSVVHCVTHSAQAQSVCECLRADPKTTDLDNLEKK